MLAGRIVPRKADMSSVSRKCTQSFLVSAELLEDDRQATRRRRRRSDRVPDEVEGVAEFAEVDLGVPGEEEIP